jgi:hypothetical protein
MRERYVGQPKAALLFCVKVLQASAVPHMARFACSAVAFLTFQAIASRGLRVMFAAHAMRNPAAPTRLRCESFTDPLAIDSERPRLSWLVHDDRRSAIQTAYQVQVASSAKMLATDDGAADLWDSGKVASDQSVHVEYDGRPLASRQACACHYASARWASGCTRTSPGSISTPQRPGSKRIIIRPRPQGSRLAHARGKFQSVYGPTESAWRVEGETFSLDVTIPPNTTASVFVPGRDAMLDGAPLAAAQGEGWAVEIGAGTYAFRSTLANP